MIGPSPAAALVAAPPAVVVAPAVVAVMAVAAVVAADPPLLLSPPQAAATRPPDTRSAVGTTHRCLVMESSPQIATRAELPKTSSRLVVTWASPMPTSLGKR